MAATTKVRNASASADDDGLLSSVSMKGNGEVMEKGRSKKGISFVSILLVHIINHIYYLMLHIQNKCCHDDMNVILSKHFYLLNLLL